jgi:hypothetical protein
VGQAVECIGGDVLNPTGDLVLERAVVKGAIVLYDFKVQGEVDLLDASTGAYQDDERNWPGKGRLRLQGFQYNLITARPKDAAARLRWLQLDSRDSSESYRQLAKVLSDAGDAAGAREVLMAMESKLSINEPKPLQVARWMIGYGYQPQRLGWPMMFAAGLGALIYWRAYRMSGIVPRDRDAFDSVNTKPSAAWDALLPEEYPRFHPFIYSLERTLPLVNLGQGERWHPRQPSKSSERRVGWVRWVVWFHILLGWLLATLFLAGLTGIIKHS